MPGWALPRLTLLCRLEHSARSLDVKGDTDDDSGPRTANRTDARGAFGTGAAAGAGAARRRHRKRLPATGGDVGARRGRFRRTRARDRAAAERRRAAGVRRRAARTESPGAAGRLTLESVHGTTPLRCDHL